MTVKKKNGNDPKNGFLGILVTLIKEVGTLSFVVVMVTYVFIVFSTVEQKKEFIDKFFLLKNAKDEPAPFVLIVVVLILIIVFQGYFNSKNLKILKDENERLGAEKSILESALLNKKLNSSRS